MPELPDLEVFSHNLKKVFRGKKLKTINIKNRRKLAVSPAALKKAVEGQSVNDVYRDGKELHFLFRNGSVLGLHMMLRGELHYFGGEIQLRFTIAEMLFENAPGLALTDYQGQATVTLNPQVKETPDAFSPPITGPGLQKILAGKRAAIKNILLDQHVIRGIGNAYADEILWHARISPFAAAGKIPGEAVKALARSIRSVLTAAQKKILKDHPGIIGGEVRDFLKIHNAKKTHSPAGAKIRIKKSGARKTYYTDEQKMYA